ncbi:MAG TPA: TetR/AcrR family transcriptional regulator [Pseudonocardiaceae bacterium]
MSPRKAAALRDDTRSLRDHLIAAAARLIAEQGTAGLTVRAIARAAGVADGVLYNHFADKEDLLAAALRAHVRTVEDGLPTLPQPGTGGVEANLRAQLAYGLALHRAILPAFAGLVGQPAVLARFTELNDNGGQWRDRLLDYLTAEQVLGRIAPDADVGAAGAILVGVCHETVLSTLLTGAPSAPSSVESVITVVLKGIDAS